MAQKPSQSFDETHLGISKDADAAAVYLDECLTDGNVELFTEALKHVANACPHRTLT